MNIKYQDEICQIIIEEFVFLKDLDFVFVKNDLEEKNQLIIQRIVYYNNTNQKEVTISSSINNSLDQEFFLTSSIVSIPYESVNDFVSFDVYLRKALNIITDTTIRFSNDSFKLDLIRKDVHSYAALFKAHGIKLIISKEKFPHYYPEWT